MSYPSGFFSKMLFDSHIAVRGTLDGTQISTTVRACLVDDGIGDPLSDGATATDCVNVTAFIRRADWPYKALPTIGLDLTDEQGVSYSVKRVARLGDCLSLAARSK